MAVWQKETDSCTGRGFSATAANGFLAKFYTWVTKAAASGGPAWYMHDDQSALATDPYIVVCDVSSPTVNDYNTGKSGGAPKFLKVGLVTTESGYIRCQAYLWWDNSTQTGYGLWSGNRLETYDSADFGYDFRGGDDGLVIQTRLGTAWDTFIIDDFVGDSNLLEGTSATGVLQSGITAGSSVVLQLDTGEAANFTENQYYYIYDFDSHSWVNYTKCTNVNTGSDQITLETLAQNFPAGAVVSSYAHRYYTCTNDPTSNVNDINYSNGNLKIPYCSSDVDQTYVFHDQTTIIYGFCRFDFATNTISGLAPDDYGVYAVQRPLIAEYGKENTQYVVDTDMNRAYGVAKNVYITKTGTMAQMVDGRTINSKNYLYFQPANKIYQAGSSTYCGLILDTEATS
jgi:hypothetical protein